MERVHKEILYQEDNYSVLNCIILTESVSVGSRNKLNTFFFQDYRRWRTAELSYAHYLELRYLNMRRNGGNYMSTTTNYRTIKMVELALLTAIIILMSFTPIGYLRIFAVEITLIVIPVTVGAIVLGPAGGAILGAVFGITSFIQCFGYSAFGAALLGINPVTTFILCMVPRILMGWLTGIIFTVLRKFDKTKSISYLVASLAGPLLNTIFFMIMLVLFFYNTDYIQGIAEGMGTNNVFAFVIALVGVNGLAEAGACVIIGSVIAKTLDVIYKKPEKSQK